MVTPLGLDPSEASFCWDCGEVEVACACNQLEIEETLQGHHQRTFNDPLESIHQEPPC